jgi:hypothetical protein
VVHPEMGTLLPYLTLYVFFISVLGNSFYSKPVHVSASLSSVSISAKLTEPEGEGVAGTLIYSRSVRSTGKISWARDRHLRWGGWMGSLGA